MKKQEIADIINNYQKIRYEKNKISYFILKPNSARNYTNIINEIEKLFTIEGQYAIFDYDKINMLLHHGQESAIKYLIPISRYYYDYCGNYAILILISKKNIIYEDMCKQVCKLKKKIRELLHNNYFSFIFDVSKIGELNCKQHIEILSDSDKIIKKDSMNQSGTFMIFYINELHSPDSTIENTIQELKLLVEQGILDEKNQINSEIINSIRKYKSYEFLKDLK